MAFVAWGAVAGRSAELAEALGGEARCFYPPGAGRPPVLVRYLLSTVFTVAYLARRRPETVVLTNPPVPAALVGFLAARALGVRFALDSHPGGFGAQGDRASGLLQPVHRRLARRATATIVAAPEWSAIVESWGGRPVVVHEAPGRWTAASHPRHERLRVLYVGRFARDEPWQAVVAAAALVPGCDVLVTGHLEDCPEQVRSSAPRNVRFVGYLGPEEYRRAVEDADVVLTLSTDPGSVMRAAYEAVYAGRPLVVSDWPVARELFPRAVHVANDAHAIAAGLETAGDRYEELVRLAAEARASQLTRWEEQRRRLAELLG